ncbi:MAG TPA: ABC transporter permease [Terrimicrobiaceae bacterium]|nr:ABC transporter permease [Terrimicrobiaceae bacterium]
MVTFIIRRLLISTVLLFLISVVSFFIITLTPGSPYPWGELNPKISPQVKEAFKKKFHLDRPLYEQYWLNMKGLFSGTLTSIKDDRPVLDRIGERLPATVRLNVLAIVISLTFGLLLGVYAARHAGTLPDLLTSILAFVFIALPGFWVSNLIVIGLVKFTDAPILGTQTYGTDFPNLVSLWLDQFWHLALPAMVLSIGGIAVQSRYIRASMLETLREDYIRTARAKGLGDDVIFYKHALRNSIRPLITGIGGLLPALIGGSVIIETIFAYPGLGRLGYEAVLERDYPTLVALNFIVAALVLLGNLISDLLYAVVDPRVRLE